MEVDGVVERLIDDDVDSISHQFHEMFSSCLQSVQKPNILVSGVTGAGKSSLVNAIFGRNVAYVADGVPVTRHFIRYEPPDAPIVIYDSRGLEDGYHQQFIDETSRFFRKIRESGPTPPPPPHRLCTPQSKEVHPSIAAVCNPFLTPERSPLSSSFDKHDDFDREKEGEGEGEEEGEGERECVEELRGERESVKEHIHIIWYIINAASGRFEPFEARIIREVFSPVPVFFILNKCDVATAKQLRDLTKTIESMNFDNCVGIQNVVAHRRNMSQSWCPLCLSDDVTYKHVSRQIICDSCENIIEMEETYGLPSLIQMTTSLLPDLAKEAFLFSQTVSMELKDHRAKEIVKYYSSHISMDIRGNALDDVGQMVGKIFVLWGWSLLGDKVRAVLLDDMKDEYINQKFTVRLAMIAADAIFQRRLSRSVIACLGVVVNRPLRSLYQRLLLQVEKGEPISGKNVDLNPSSSPDFADKFIKLVFEVGLDKAIEYYW